MSIYHWKRGYFQPQSSICYVDSLVVKLTGTGFLIKLEYPENTWRILFMTCYHVAKITQPNEVTGLKLIFGDNTIGNVNLTPDWVKNDWVFANEKLDVFIIELSSIALKVLSRTNYQPLYYAGPNEKESVQVFQYPGNILNVGKGHIDKIFGSTIQYEVKSETGSSGSPVLNDEFKVVGIHCGKWPVTVTNEAQVVGTQRDPMTTDKGGMEVDETKMEGPRKAVHINVIMEVYKNELIKRYGGNMKNNMELELIDQIPKNALHYIGSGGYGKVYKASIQGANYTVVKIVEGFGGLDRYKSQVEAISTEFKVITGLNNHRRIVNWTAFVRDDQNAKIFIRMEYLEGGSLFDKIKNYGRLNKTIAIKYLIEILEGLEFLHQQNVFHNDLKPANILFTADDHIKLCDFGISIHVHTDSSVTSPHLREDCYYMSPERINGEPPSATSDMWSLGVTFVVMLTGHTINHKDRFPIVNQQIAEYPKDNNKITIDGVALNKYLERYFKNDDRRMVISKTLCSIGDRLTAHSLLKQLCPNHHCSEDPNLCIDASNLSTEASNLGIGGHGYASLIARLPMDI